MATYYMDYVNGLDANSGASWGAAKKTIDGFSAAILNPGDIIRVLITSIYSSFFTYDHDPLDVEVEQAVYKFCLAMGDDEYNAIKPPFLKLIENQYYGFIKLDWNTTLKKYKIIAPEYEITIENTNESQNIQYLFMLSAINKQDYYNMSGEFDRYKRLINDNGGIMSRVKFHTSI
jgi:hypothetical protein